jgi:hypothetical protein
LFNAAERCEAVILALTPEGLSSVETCETPDGRETCFRLEFPDRRLRIILSGDAALPPFAKVTLESVIVMREERVD